MSDRSNSLPPSLEDLSALADGQLGVEQADSVASRWRDQHELRSAWHAYHLIGDVLRSDELASAGTRDEAFLQRLRGRLAAEPVVLAPAQPPQAKELQSRGEARVGAARRRWAAPAAVAAGVMVVAGALVATRMNEAPAPERTAVLALANGAEPAAASAPVVAQPAQPERVIAVNGELMRDAQLDRYLAAHKQFGGTTALGVPSGFLRGATYEAPQR